MNIGGIDIGHHNGLTIIADGPRPRCLFRCKLAGEELYAGALAAFQTLSVKLVVIERSVEVLTHGRARKGMPERVSIERAIINSAPFVGHAQLAAQHAGATVLLTTATDTRKVLGRIPSAPVGLSGKRMRYDKWIDKVIASRARLLVDGWEDGAGDNEHCRDALIAALWGLARIKLPAALTATSDERHTRRRRSQITTRRS